MSLNRTQQNITGQEMRANLVHSGLTETTLAEKLAWDRPRLDAVLNMEDADPVDVWQVRDELLTLISDRGLAPEPFTVLTDNAREEAEGWFEPREAPSA